MRVCEYYTVLIYLLRPVRGLSIYLLHTFYLELDPPLTPHVSSESLCKLKYTNTLFSKSVVCTLTEDDGDECLWCNLDIVI